MLSYRLINMADNMVKHEYIKVSIVFFLMSVSFEFGDYFYRFKLKFVCGVSDWGNLVWTEAGLFRFYSHRVWTWLGLWQRTVPEIKLQSLWTDSTVNGFSLVTFIHLQSTFTNSLYISLTWTTESLWALKPPFPETFLVDGCICYKVKHWWEND